LFWVCDINGYASQSGVPALRALLLILTAVWQELWDQQLGLISLTRWQQQLAARTFEQKSFQLHMPEAPAEMVLDFGERFGGRLISNVNRI
jgi:hypothetical protein